MNSSELRYSPTKKQLGRPKGVKNSQGKKKPRRKKKLKRGRKGVFTIFDKGKRGHSRVDPHRKTVRIGSNISNVVAATLGEIIKLYAKSFIQNNLAEHKNSMLSNYLVLSGPKTAESIERRLRTFIIAQNNPNIFIELKITHHFQKDYFFKQICNSPLRYLLIGCNCRV